MGWRIVEKCPRSPLLDNFRVADDPLVMPGNRIAGGALTECLLQINDQFVRRGSTSPDDRIVPGSHWLATLGSQFP
jgi:hypothetical protein